MKAVLKLQGLSLITPDEREKKKAEKMAYKFANELDLTDVFTLNKAKKEDDL